MKKYYKGETLECGRTSMSSKKVCPHVVYLFKRGIIQPGQFLLDYGCGKYARNTIWLAKQGVRVYAYDPFWGTHIADCGWAHISDQIPEFPYFDIIMTCYVLNVVKKQTERNIIEFAKNNAPQQIHIVRNRDLIDLAYNSINRKDKTVMEFCTNQGIKPKATKQFAKKLAVHGFQTSRGFQRLTDFSGMEFVLKETYNSKVFNVRGNK